MRFFGTVSAPPRRIGIVQGGKLGDLLIALPLAGIFKNYWPQAEVYVLAGTALKPVVDACEHVQAFVDLAQVQHDPQRLAALSLDAIVNPLPDRALVKTAYRAGVPVRVGNLRRLVCLRYCNRFVAYSRAHSSCHEVELNLKNLPAFGLPARWRLDELPRFQGLTRVPALAPRLEALLDRSRFNLVLHPKSGGSGREWPLQHYAALVRALPARRFACFVTGSAAEGAAIRAECPALVAEGGAVDLCGRLELAELMGFLRAAQGLVAAGTGPLHLAAALGIHALGLFPSLAEFGPVRWAPIGVRAESIRSELACAGRKRPCAPGNRGHCPCTAAIPPQQVLERVLRWETAAAGG